MQAIPFEGSNAVLGEGQPEYQPLPARLGHIPCEGLNGGAVKHIGVTTCYRLTADELETVLATGVIWFTTLTFGDAFQPVQPSVDKPDFI